MGLICGCIMSMTVTLKHHCYQGGIACGDPNTYYLNLWHVITPEAIKKHLNWRSSEPTQFISFYGNLADAQKEQARRQAMPWIDARSVRIVQVEIDAASGVWAFNRDDLLNMMNSFGRANYDIFTTIHPQEWLVWEFVPRNNVRQIIGGN